METEFALSLGTQRWTLPAESDTITIGRASNADIRLQADDQISRIHARLGRTGTTWTLYDESRNGTGLNGRRLAAPTPLTEGDRIHIGRSVLTFHETPVQAPAEPAPSPAASAPGPAASAPAAMPPTAAAPPPAHFGTPSPATPPPPAAPVPENPSPFIPADLTSPRQTPPADANRPSPFAPVSEPGYFTPADPEPDARPFTPTDPESEAGRFTPADHASDAGPFTPADHASESGPFAADEAEGSPFGSAGSGSLDNAAPPPAPPDIPRREDAPGNFPLFPDEPSYEGTDEDAPWAAYPSDNSELANPPWDQGNSPAAQPSWNESASWPDTSRAHQADRLPPTDRVGSDDDGSEEVGTVRLLRVLLIAGAVIVLGLVINLIVTFLADGPGGALRWFVPPAIALVLAMIIALLDAAAPKGRAAGRLDVSIVVAIVVVLVGVGVGGFALTAGAEYVGGYLTGNESGEARLIKPVAKTVDGLTVTVQNVTYTSHFTRVDLLVKNTGKQAVRLPLKGNATFSGGEGNGLRADAARSQWPGSIPAGGSEHGTITFTGHLPDATTAAALTLKSGDTDVAVSGIVLTK
ncbi:FHA domain-containing protein [Kribbella sp. CWNU-51]